MYTATGTRGLGGYELLPAQGKLTMAGIDPPSPGGRELEGGGLLLSCGGEKVNTPPPLPPPSRGRGKNEQPSRALTLFFK